MGRAPVNGDLLRPPVAAARLGQEPLGGRLVPVLGEEKVDGLARWIDGALERAPRALDPAVGLVHAPPDPHRALPPMKRRCQ